MSTERMVNNCQSERKSRMFSKQLFFTAGFVLLAVISKSLGAPPQDRSEVKPKALFRGPQLYLSVSPEAGFKYVADTNETTETVEFLDRMLEMHWLNFDNQSGDMIGLYTANPMGMNASAIEAHLLEQHSVPGSSGKKKTSVRYDRRPLNVTMDRCLGFWVAYLQTNDSGTTVIQSSCLMIHPTWMNDIKDQIHNVPLSSLMIPGTHNAGAWIYYNGLESEGVYIEYTFCQEDNIYDQLMSGIRSLDVRVGHYKGAQGKFYINHDLARIRPLETLLDDVYRFVEETNEIVLLDFHRFPVGFSDEEVHHELVEFVQQKLGRLLAPKSLSLSVTPGKLFELKKTIIIFYSETSIASKYDILWPGINQAWADANVLGDLESYQETALTNNGCKGNAWAAMAHLTTTVQDALIRPSFGVRGYANVSNDAVSQWYQRESWYSRSMIVAVDFYRSTNVIETAIEVNKNNANRCV